MKNAFLKNGIIIPPFTTATIARISDSAALPRTEGETILRELLLELKENTVVPFQQKLSECHTALTQYSFDQKFPDEYTLVKFEYFAAATLSSLGSRT